MSIQARPRFCGSRAGEVLISDAAYTASELDLGELEQRELELKGKSKPTSVRVLYVSRE